MSDTKETKFILGAAGGDTPRQYTFQLTEAIDGLSIVNDYSAMAIAALPQITAVFNVFAPDPDDPEPKEVGEGEFLRQVLGELEKGDGPILAFARILPHILTTPRLLSLCKTFLAGAEIDGEKCDDNGMCKMFARRPHEVYIALFWALAANYPDYILPLLASPDDDDTPGDNSQVG